MPRPYDDFPPLEMPDFSVPPPIAGGGLRALRTPRVESPFEALDRLEREKKEMDAAQSRLARLRGEPEPSAPPPPESRPVAKQAPYQIPTGLPDPIPPPQPVVPTVQPDVPAPGQRPDRPATRSTEGAGNAAQAFGRGFERNAGEAVGGTVGLWAGAKGGAALGAAIGTPFGGVGGAIGAAAGGLIGGLLGMFGGGWLGKQSQKAVMGEEAWNRAEEQYQRDMAAHPNAALLGSLAPHLATLAVSPGGALKLGAKGAKAADAARAGSVAWLEAGRAGKVSAEAMQLANEVKTTGEAVTVSKRWIRMTRAAVEAANKTGAAKTKAGARVVESLSGRILAYNTALEKEAAALAAARKAGVPVIGRVGQARVAKASLASKFAHMGRAATDYGEDGEYNAYAPEVYATTGDRLLSDAEVAWAAAQKGEKGFINQLATERVADPDKLIGSIPFLGSWHNAAKQRDLEARRKRLADPVAAYGVAYHDNPQYLRDRERVIADENARRIDEAREQTVRGIAGQIIGDMPAFMVEIANTPELGNLGAARGALARVGGGMLQAAIQSNFQPGAVAANYERNRGNEWTITEDEWGALNLAVQRAGNSTVKAMWKGWAQNAVEYVSEVLGEYMQGAVAAGGRRMMKAKSAMPKKLGQFFAEVFGDTPAIGRVRGTLRAGAVQPFFESLEERAGDFLKAALFADDREEGEGYWQHLLSALNPGWKQWVAETLAFAPMGAVQVAGALKDRKRMEREAREVREAGGGESAGAPAPDAGGAAPAAEASGEDIPDEALVALKDKLADFLRQRGAPENTVSAVASAQNAADIHDAMNAMVVDGAMQALRPRLDEEQWGKLQAYRDPRQRLAHAARLVGRYSEMDNALLAASAALENEDAPKDLLERTVSLLTSLKPEWRELAEEADTPRDALFAIAAQANSELADGTLNPADPRWKDVTARDLAARLQGAEAAAQDARIADLAAEALVGSLPANLREQYDKLETPEKKAEWLDARLRDPNAALNAVLAVGRHISRPDVDAPDAMLASALDQLKARFAGAWAVAGGDSSHGTPKERLAALVAEIDKDEANKEFLEAFSRNPDAADSYDPAFAEMTFAGEDALRPMRAGGMAEDDALADAGNGAEGAMPAAQEAPEGAPAPAPASEPVAPSETPQDGAEAPEAVPQTESAERNPAESGPTREAMQAMAASQVQQIANDLGIKTGGKSKTQLIDAIRREHNGVWEPAGLTAEQRRNATVILSKWLHDGDSVYLADGSRATVSRDGAFGDATLRSDKHGEIILNEDRALRVLSVYRGASDVTGDIRTTTLGDLPDTTKEKQERATLIAKRLPGVKVMVYAQENKAKIDRLLAETYKDDPKGRQKLENSFKEFEKSGKAFYDPKSKTIWIGPRSDFSSLPHEVFHSIIHWSEAHAPGLHQQLTDLLKDPPESALAWARENYQAERETKLAQEALNAVRDEAVRWANRHYQGETEAVIRQKAGEKAQELAEQYFEKHYKERVSDYLLEEAQAELWGRTLAEDISAEERAESRRLVDQLAESEMSWWDKVRELCARILERFVAHVPEESRGRAVDGKPIDLASIEKAIADKTATPEQTARILYDAIFGGTGIDWQGKEWKTKRPKEEGAPVAGAHDGLALVSSEGQLFPDSQAGQPHDLQGPNGGLPQNADTLPQPSAESSAVKPKRTFKLRRPSSASYPILSAVCGESPLQGRLSLANYNKYLQENAKRYGVGNGGERTTGGEWDDMPEVFGKRGKLFRYVFTNQGGQTPDQLAHELGLSDVKELWEKLEQEAHSWIESGLARYSKTYGTRKAMGPVPVSIAADDLRPGDRLIRLDKASDVLTVTESEQYPGAYELKSDRGDLDGALLAPGQSIPVAARIAEAEDKTWEAAGLGPKSSWWANSKPEILERAKALGISLSDGSKKDLIAAVAYSMKARLAEAKAAHPEIEERRSKQELDRLLSRGDAHIPGEELKEGDILVLADGSRMAVIRAEDGSLELTGHHGIRPIDPYETLRAASFLRDGRDATADFPAPEVAPPAAEEDDVPFQRGAPSTPFRLEQQTPEQIAEENAAVKRLQKQEAAARAREAAEQAKADAARRQEFDDLYQGRLDIGLPGETDSLFAPRQNRKWGGGGQLFQKGGMLESIRYEMEDNGSEPSVDSLLDEWDNASAEGVDRKHWPLIPADQYRNALRRFMRDGDRFVFPERILRGWLRLCTKNLMEMSVITGMAGHDSWDATPEIEEHYDGDASEFDLDAFIDWARLPEGSTSVSDYGLAPIYRILDELDENATSGQMIVALNRILDVMHMNGDLSAAFIEGGRKTLSSISNDRTPLFQKGATPSPLRDWTRATIPEMRRELVARGLSPQGGADMLRKRLAEDDERRAESDDGIRFQRDSVRPWPKDFPKVVVHTTRQAIISKHAADFEKAKAGDLKAAVRLVRAVVKPERVRELVARHPNAIVVPVNAVEASGHNRIPIAYAKMLADAGLEEGRGIVQSVKANHTGADAFDRLLRRAEFSGPVQAGREYILVDDHVTQGGSLSELRHYIENNGGKVVEISTLTASKGSTTLPIQEGTIAALKAKFGPNLANELAAANIAGTLEALTESEGRYLLKLSPDTFRSRIASAGLRQLLGPDGLQRPVQEVGQPPAVREENSGQLLLDIPAPAVDAYASRHALTPERKAGLSEGLKKARRFAEKTRAAYDRAFHPGATGENWREAFSTREANRGKFPTVSRIIRRLYERPGSFGAAVKGLRLDNAEDVAAMMMSVRSPFQEMAKVVFVDGKRRVLDARIVHLGGIDMSLLDPITIFGDIPKGAKGFILSHNHPSGNPAPSREDQAMTRKFRWIADVIGLQMHDHVVTDGERYWSFMMGGEGTLPEGRQSHEDWEIGQPIQITQWQDVSHIAGLVRQGADTGVVLALDTQNCIRSVRIIPKGFIDALREKEAGTAYADAFFGHALDTGANGVIVYLPKGTLERRQVERIASDASALNIHVVDIVQDAEDPASIPESFASTHPAWLRPVAADAGGTSYRWQRGAPPARDWSSATIPELRRELASRGLSTQGDAERLRIRLSGADRRSTLDTGNDPDNGIRWQADRTVERRKDLVAFHNVDAKGLAGMESLGGLAMPSFSVTKDTIGGSEFGEISLLVHPRTIDPKNPHNKIFTNDAWTPTFPDTKLKMDAKVVDRLQDRILGLLRAPANKGWQEVARSWSADIDSENIDDAVNRMDGDAVAAIRDRNTYKIAFALETGRAPALERRDRELFKDSFGLLAWADNSIMQAVSERLGDRLIRDGAPLSYDEALALAQDKGFLKELADIIDESGPRKALRKEAREAGLEEPPLASQIDVDHNRSNYLRNIRDLADHLSDWRRRGIPQDVDRAAAARAIDGIVDANREEYEAWLRGLVNGITDGKRYVRNKRDVFTPDGTRRRPFSQLYDELTLASAVKAMRQKQVESGGGIFGRNPFGVAARKYPSLQAVIADEARLQPKDKQKYEARRRELGDRFSGLASKLADTYTGGEDNRFTVHARAADALLEEWANARGNKPAVLEGIKQWYGYRPTMEIVDELARIMHAMSSMPEDYFEAKAYRAVGFDEIAAALVPDDATPETRGILSKHGIRTIDYKAGDAADRLAKLNTAADEAGIKFQKGDSTPFRLEQQTPEQIAAEAAEAKRLRQQEEAERAREAAKQAKADAARRQQFDDLHQGRLDIGLPGETDSLFAPRQRTNRTGGTGSLFQRGGAPAGVQKRAGTAYPDAGTEIGRVRFQLGARRREEYGRILARKRPDLDPAAVLAELDKYDNPKKEKAALHWTVRGTIRLPEDEYKVDDALSVAEKAHVSPLDYASPLALMDTHKQYKPTAKPIDPETVPELSKRRDEGDGIVSYEVEDAREGQRAMRRIIDTHWGEDANPWCLLARTGARETPTAAFHVWLNRKFPGRPMTREEVRRYAHEFEETGGKAYDTIPAMLGDDAWSLWQHYSALPKRVAFKNGKLLAFMATSGDGEWGYDEHPRRQEYEDEVYDSGLEWADAESFEDWLARNYPEEQSAPDAAEEWWDRQDESHPDLDWARFQRGAAPARDWSSATIPELRRELVRRGLSPSGSAAALRRRLEEADQRNAQPEEGGVRWQFGGEQGAARLGLATADEARRMEADGADRTAIWRKTGWWKGKDGKWRVELPDIPDGEFSSILGLVRNGLDTTYRVGRVTGRKYYPVRMRDLGPVSPWMENLLRAYPALEDVWVFARNGKTTRGGYLGVTSFRKDAEGQFVPSIIEIGTRFRTGKNLRGTFLHEIQHAIQAYEGFPNGAAGGVALDSGDASAGEDGEAEALAVSNRSKMTDEERAATPPWVSVQKAVASRSISKILAGLDKARGKTREEIFREFDNTQREIGSLPEDLELPRELDVRKRVVMGGQAYILDHLLNRPEHERPLSADDARRLLALIDPNNEMRKVPQRGSYSLAFIAENPDGGWDCTVIAPRRGEFYVFKTMFAQEKKPYQDKALIRYSAGSGVRDKAVDSLLRGPLASIRDNDRQGVTTPQDGLGGNEENPADQKFQRSGIFTGSAADYAQRLPDGSIANGPSLLHIGSGEGSQVYGWGLYGSTVRGVAERYAKEGVAADPNPMALAKAWVDFHAGNRKRAIDWVKNGIKNGYFDKVGDEEEKRKHARKIEEALRILESGTPIVAPRGNIYEQTWFTNRATPEETERHLLKWYEPVTGKQAAVISEKIRDLARFSTSKRNFRLPNDVSGLTGMDIYVLIENFFKTEDGYDYDEAAKNTSEFLRDECDIDGIKYPVDSYGGKSIKDGDTAGWNYVSFRDDNITVDHKWRDGQQLFQKGGDADGQLRFDNPWENAHVELLSGKTGHEWHVRSADGEDLGRYTTQESAEYALTQERAMLDAVGASLSKLKKAKIADIAEARRKLVALIRKADATKADRADAIAALGRSLGLHKDLAAKEWALAESILRSRDPESTETAAEKAERAVNTLLARASIRLHGRDMMRLVKQKAGGKLTGGMRKNTLLPVLRAWDLIREKMTADEKDRRLDEMDREIEALAAEIQSGEGPELSKAELASRMGTLAEKMHERELFSVFGGLSTLHGGENRARLADDARAWAAASAALSAISDRAVQELKDKLIARAVAAKETRDQMISDLTGGRGVPASNQERQDAKNARGWRERAAELISGLVAPSMGGGKAWGEMITRDKSVAFGESTASHLFHDGLSAGYAAEMKANEADRTEGLRILSQHFDIAPDTDIHQLIDFSEKCASLFNDEAVDENGNPEVTVRSVHVKRDGKKREVTVVPGGPCTLKLGELMHFYLIGLQAEEAAGQPYTDDPKRSKGTDCSLMDALVRHGYSAETMMEIRAALKKRGLDTLALQISADMEKKGDALDALMAKEYNSRLKRVHPYAPLRRLHWGLTENGDAEGGGVGSFMSMVRSFLKERVANTRDFKTVNLIESWQSHNRQANHIIHLHDWISTVGRVMRHADMQAALDFVVGDKTRRALNAWLDIQARGGSMVIRDDDHIGLLARNFAVAVTTNPRVALKQLTSPGMALGMLPEGASTWDWFKDMAEIALPGETRRRFLAFLDGNSPEWRERGLNASDALQLINRHKAGDKWELLRLKVQRKLGAMTRWGDRNGALLGCYGVFRAWERKYLAEGMDPSAAKIAALEKFVDSVNAGQQSTLPEYMSQVQTIGGLYKYMAMFHTAQVAMTRNIYIHAKAIMEKRGDWRHHARALVGVVVSAFAFRLMGKALQPLFELVRGLFEGDKDKAKEGAIKTLQEGVLAVIEAPCSGVMPLGDALVGLADFTLKGGSSWGRTGNVDVVPQLSVLANVERLVSDFRKKADNRDWQAVARHAADFIGQTTGIPLTPAIDVISGQHDLWTGIDLTPEQRAARALTFSRSAIGAPKRKPAPKPATQAPDPWAIPAGQEWMYGLPPQATQAGLRTAPSPRR